MRVPTLASGEDDFYYDWYNAARAIGDPTASGNTRRIRFDYGFPTGISIVGVNFESSIGGFSASGEYTRSTRFFQAPSADGKRFERQASALYVNVSREIGNSALLGLDTLMCPTIIARISPSLNDPVAVQRSAVDSILRSTWSRTMTTWTSGRIG